MLKKMAPLVLVLLCTIFTAVASLGLFAPKVLFDPSILSLDTLAGMAEIRAAYGGLFGGVAVVFGLGAAKASIRGLALGLAVLVLGGFTLGRLVSWGLDGTPTNHVAIANLIVEAIGFIALGLIYRAHHRTVDEAAPQTS